MNTLIHAVKRSEVRMMMAFVIGLGIATLLREPCKGIMCRKLVAPNLQEVEGKVWRHGAGCLRVRLNSTPCGDAAAKKTIIPVV